MEFNAPSGAPVVINAASFEEALNLKDAMEREAADSLSRGFLGMTLLVDSSPVVRAALWPCLARCLHNGQKITKETFNKREIRGDYYDIVEACIKENLGPLGESLRLKLLAYGIIQPQAPTEKNPKSESTASGGLSPAD